MLFTNDETDLKMSSLDGIFSFPDKTLSAPIICSTNSTGVATEWESKIIDCMLLFLCQYFAALPD